MGLHPITQEEFCSTVPWANHNRNSREDLINGTFRVSLTSCTGRKCRMKHYKRCPFNDLHHAAFESNSKGFNLGQYPTAFMYSITVYVSYSMYRVKVKLISIERESVYQTLREKRRIKKDDEKKRHKTKIALFGNKRKSRQF